MNRQIFVILVFFLLFPSIAIPSMKGDVSGDGDVDLVDTILALKIACGYQLLINDIDQVDINSDNKIGIEEAIFGLWYTAGLLADSDNDGVYDVFDSCPGTPANSAVDKSGCSLPTP